jgi:hypothetical protein
MGSGRVRSICEGVSGVRESREENSTLVRMFSLWVMREGNLPALFKPGARRGI